MIHIRWLLLLLLTLPLPARAADVVFPPGSRIGLAPPPGLSAAHNFFGFEDRNNGAVILLVALPAQAYGEVVKSTEPEILQQQGVAIEAREDLSLPTGKGVLVIGRQRTDAVRRWFLVAQLADVTAVATAQFPDAAAAAYPDAAVRTALASLASRASVPVDEQLSLLPFNVTELAAFHVGGLIAGRSLLLTDAMPDATSPIVEARLLVALFPGGPGPGDDRSAFARDALATVPDLKDVHLTSSEPLRIGGIAGYQIMAEAKDNATSTDVTIVQWLRFGGGAYMQIVGVAPTQGWIKAYGRFRQVRDGIEPR
jgi:hypothetical protein